MNTSAVTTLFFGSTTDSVIVLDALTACSVVRISAVVTQPPKPVGRNGVLTPTPVQDWAKKQTVTALSFPNAADKPWLYADEQKVINTLESVGAELIISASYGQKIPTKTLADARYGGLNVHPSILPRWRGGDPVPWAIMTGDHQTGVTVVSLAEHFDEGFMYAQKKIPVTDTDTSGPLRTKLFTIGAELLTSLLPQYLAGKAKGKPQTAHDEPYAKRLTRDTGFEPWDTFWEALAGNMKEATRIGRKFRALTPWPGLWTTVFHEGKEKRLKLISAIQRDSALIPETVQLEGKNPVSWKQFTTAYPLLIPASG